MSVEQDGRYVEDVHWERQVYIGGGSCGRCWQCIDLKTQKLFAIKQVRRNCKFMMIMKGSGMISQGDVFSVKSFRLAMVVTYSQFN